MARINARNVLLVAVPLIIVGTVVLTHSSPPGDSPGEVVGGSIYLKWKPSLPGASICASNPRVFCAYGGDTTKLDFENLPGMTTITVKDGWRIRISNKDPRGGKDSQPSELEDMLVVCSDVRCSLDPGDGKTYYIKTRSGVVVAKHQPHPNELHFHDKNQACPGDDEDDNCDKAVHFRFEFGAAKPQSSACDTSGGKECKVFIGNRDIQFWWRKYF
jgi:hypothetical protein